MKTEQTLETLSTRHMKATAARDLHLERGNETLADKLQVTCSRLTAAICYLEARVERLEKASAR